MSFSVARPQAYPVLKQIQKRYPTSELMALVSAGATTLFYALGGPTIAYEGLTHTKKSTEPAADPTQRAITKSIQPPWPTPQPLPLTYPYGLSNGYPGTTAPWPQFPPTLPQPLYPPRSIQWIPVPQQGHSADWFAPSPYRHPYFGNTAAVAGAHRDKVIGEQTGVYVKTLKPKTKLGQFGLDAGRIGVGLAAFAGVFNGIRMRMPLMSIGDSLNIIAAPIVHTPLGLGLFHIGIASIFASRAIEQDETKQLDMSRWHQDKNLLRRTQQVLHTSYQAITSMIESVTTTGKNLVQLAGQNSRAAQGFFKNEFLTLTPRKILFAERLTANGKTLIQPMMKTSPYLMHTASFFLGLGGILTVLGSLFNLKGPEYAGYRMSVSGGSLDNLSLARQGFEKAAIGNPAGVLQTVSGLTILSGQNFVDTLWGRGLYWSGIALLFAVFGRESLRDFARAMSMRKTDLWPETTALIRRWELDPRPLIKDNAAPQFKQLNKVMRSFHDPVAFDREMKALAQLNPTLSETIQTVLKQFDNKPFRKQTSAVQAQLNKEIQHTGLSLSLDQPAKDVQKLLTQVRQNNQRLFGTST